ncbi:MAG: M20/M25/M40 family metallo-hydrolase [Vicinamibacteraceae bacterium]
MLNPLRRGALIVALGLLLRPDAALAQAQPAPSSGVAPATRTRAHVDALASPKLEGRLTGSPGADAAAAYIERELKRIGAQPLPGATGFRVPFTFTQGVKDEGASVALAGDGATPGHVWRDKSAVAALTFSETGDVNAPIVFAGYGLRAPAENGGGFVYDSYAGLDVKDKIVLVLRYVPEKVEREQREQLVRFSALRYKALAARQAGAKAILIVTGPTSAGSGQVIPLTFDTAAAGSGIVAASVSGAVADALFATAGKSLREAQDALDTGNPHAAGFALGPRSVRVDAKLTRQVATTYNVAGYLPATRAVGGIAKPWLMLGAHYDHLGHGGRGSSLARAGEETKVHPGADDNASGVAAVLAAAEHLKNGARGRNVAFVFWSGEEAGLLGSAAFTAKPPLPLDQLAAYFNFDMVGRLRDNALQVQGAGSSPSWAALATSANADPTLKIAVQNDPNLPTDSSTFNQASIPTLSFFTGSHEDYHRPTDTADRVDAAGIDRIVAYASTIVSRVADAAEPPAFAKVEPQTRGRGARDGIRLYTGTIPDYATETKGLLLGGVSAGGPAEQAGLQKGDVIVEIAGQSIANVYDYTYALDLMKADEPAKVIYLRNGEKKETTLTPRVRR